MSDPPDFFRADRMPQVSVVIPVFNSARLIGHALRSVFAQTFQDFEVTVVDDGSDDRDELLAVLAEWSGRIRYIRKPNGGPASARNLGIAESRGSLIAFLDADDEWLPGKLARQVEYFARHPETGLLHTAVVGQRAGGAAPGPPRPAFCDLFHTVFFVNTLTVMVPRSVLEQVGPFDERREVHIEDWDLWLRIAARFPFGYLDEPLAMHRPGGWMSRQVERTYSAQALVMEKNRALCAQACSEHRANPAQCLRRRRFVLHRDWGYDRLVAGNRTGARELLGRALRLSPWHPRTAALYLSTFLPRRRRAAKHALVNGAPRGRVRTASPAPSLVHDTLYRRLRRRAIARLHDADDAIRRRAHERRRVLFDAASPMSFAVFRPVYERLRQDPRLDLWFTAHGRVWAPEAIYGPAGITTNVVPPGIAAWMKVDLYINADFWDMTWLYRRTRRIHLFHGVAGKYGLDAPVDLAPTIAAFDSLMFANEDRRSRYIEAGLVPDDDIKAALVGYPKVDCLVDGSIDGRAVLGSLGLDPRRPTVIYAPTWSPYSSLHDIGDELIARIAAAGLQVIVKLHDRSYDRRLRGSGGIDWAERLARYDAHPLVRAVRDADGSPFLAASDALISDHSSIAFEFMLLDRPIVVIDRPELIRQAGVNPQKAGLLRSASRVVRDARGATQAVSAALRRPDEFGAERRRIAGGLFYGAGTATERAVALIYGILEMPALDGRHHTREEPAALSAAG